jgi:hypothetical protein
MHALLAVISLHLVVKELHSCSCVDDEQGCAFASFASLGLFSSEVQGVVVIGQIVPQIQLLALIW